MPQGAHIDILSIIIPYAERMIVILINLNKVVKKYRGRWTGESQQTCAASTEV